MLTHNRPLLLTLLVFFASSMAVTGQEPVAFERSKVLAKYGSVFWKATPQQIPTKHGVGETVDVEQSGATTMRLHFKAQSAPVVPTWMIEILSTSDAVLWTYTPAAGEEEFWSAEVRGPKVKVRVINTQVDSPLRVAVNAIAVTQVLVKPQAITPPDDREPILTQPDETKALGKAVARIRFIGDDGPMYVCTGFLVSPDLLMTNQHCPQSETEWRSALIDFDFDAPAVTPKTTTFKQFLIANVELDFAIYRLTTKFPGRTPLQMDGMVPSNNRAMMIIQHPAGESKQVSLINCRVSGIPVRGVTPKLTDFGHPCDTLGGSSGSGLMDVETKKIIGLHHLGFKLTDACIVNTTDACLVNRAVLMQQVIAFIKANRPDIAAEIGLTP